MNTDTLSGNIEVKANVTGNTPGIKGDTGNGIKSITLNDDYTLTLNYTNGTSETTSSIRGEKGDKGDKGNDGTNGVDGAIQYTAGDGVKIENNIISAFTKTSELENDSNFITSNSDVIKSLQSKKTEIIELLNVTDISPETCSMGDKYYNTTTNKIYTAIADNTWNEGDDPSSVFLYVDLTNSRLYYYDGTNFKSYGGGDGSSGDTLPVGSVVSYSGETAPTNWLICDGSAVSRTTYADLFSVIGTTYGSGDGSTTFNLPNLKGKVITGLDSSDSDFNTIGKTGGEKTHTLTKEELPKIDIKTNYASSSGGTGDGLVFGTKAGESNNVLVGNVNFGNQPHNNLQPYVVQNYIIKAFQSAGVVANVAQSKTTSDTDTYSCNYINEIGKITNLFGNVMGDDGGYGIEGYGKVTATKISADGIWKFDIENIMTYSSSAEYYMWGFDITKISSLLNNKIGVQVQFDETLREKCSWDAFKTNGTRYIDQVHYGSITKHNSNYLLPARYYGTNGAVGGWGIQSFENPTYFKATIYLREV